MPLEPHTVRFSSDLWAATEIAAKHRGESIGQYIRTAVLSRCAYDLGRRGDELTERFDALWREAGEAGRNLGEVYDLGGEG